jgi:PAS domain S-box-containing protein
MASRPESFSILSGENSSSADLFREAVSYSEAEAVLQDLAKVFFENTSLLASSAQPGSSSTKITSQLPNLEAKYRALVEQIPAVVFMAYLDEGVGEAYVSPQIEAVLGFTQEEWLQDPVRWYSQVHPDDKQRWSLEAAELFLTGKPLRSAYRILSRDNRVIWLHCEAKMIRREDGHPWFIHGVGFDITDLKRTEEALEEERNVVTAILDTVGALVIVLDPEGRIVRFNRACQRITGRTFADVSGLRLWDLFIPDEDAAGFRSHFEKMRLGQLQSDYECQWLAADGTRRLIAWSGTSLRGGKSTPTYVIATGIDITERKHLEKAILDISAREQRRIGQDLHDGLGQHLTGIAFMTKVQEQKLKEQNLPYAVDAEKIVKLVNEAIHKTRELARGLSPVVSEAHGLMSALQQLSAEVEGVFGVSCQLQCEAPVLIYDVGVATHLYHISQEAINNAIKHGKATKIEIGLSASDNRGLLTIHDNGSGYTKIPGHGTGMGHHIMSHRAKMIGGTLDIEPHDPHGTVVRCDFPVPEAKQSVELTQDDADSKRRIHA